MTSPWRTKNNLFDPGSTGGSSGPANVIDTSSKIEVSGDAENKLVFVCWWRAIVVARNEGEKTVLVDNNAVQYTDDRYELKKKEETRDVRTSFIFSLGTLVYDVISDLWLPALVVRHLLVAEVVCMIP